MISLKSCPRCKGAVMDSPNPNLDSPMSITCGWRKSDVSAEVLAQVQAHLGEPDMEDRYTHSRIGTGKPPLSGWDRVKRRRERERIKAQDATEATG